MMAAIPSQPSLPNELPHRRLPIAAVSTRLRGMRHKRKLHSHRAKVACVGSGRSTTSPKYATLREAPLLQLFDLLGLAPSDQLNRGIRVLRLRNDMLIGDEAIEV